MSKQDQDQENSSKSYALSFDKSTLTIQGNKKVKQITFDDEITALTRLEGLPFALVGLKNGRVILHNIKNKQLSTLLPIVHEVAISALYGDEKNFFTADNAGINYIWHNPWSNTLHTQKIRTRSPVLICKGTKNFFALQYQNSLIEYPRITILERSTLKILPTSHFGTLLELLPDNTLLIEQDRGRFNVTHDGIILKRYACNVSEK